MLYMVKTPMISTLGIEISESDVSKRETDRQAGTVGRNIR
jgi:hypothetical protein